MGASAAIWSDIRLLTYRRNLFILCFTVFLAAMSWNQIVPFLPLFLKDLGVTGSVVGWSGLVFAAQSLAAIFMQPFWGRMGDRVGRKPMIIRAGLCLAVIYFGMSICRTAWQLTLLRFLNGALTGFIPGSFALIATNTPDGLSGRYVATAQSASAIGGIAGPVAGGILAALLGRRGSLRLCSLTVLIATILVIMFVREENRPESDGKTSLLTDFRRTLSLQGMPLLLGIALLGAAVNPAIQPILALHLQILDSTRPVWFDGIAYAMPGAAFAAFAYLWSRAGELYTRHLMMGIGLAGATLALLFLGVATSLWTFVAGYFMLGVCLAALGPNTAAYIASEVPCQVRGRTYGILQAANTAGAFVAPLGAGVVGQALGLRWVFVMLAGVTMTGVVLLFRAGKFDRLKSAMLKTGVAGE